MSLQITIPIADATLDSALQNQYRLLHQLGEGGSGSVFKAIQKNTGKIVAIKLLHHEDVTIQKYGQHDRQKMERMVLRFERETTLCAQLQHPNIVSLLDKGQTENGQLFAVFEFVPGETLKDLLIRKGSLSASETGELMGQVLDALACAHAHGIVHRDLKPHNIMISATGTRNHVKVLDFGIAGMVAERDRADYHNLTLTQESMCSPAYSAPEQLRGEPPTVKMDIYAWGLLCLECLTGQAAITGQTVAEIFHKQLSNMEVPMPAALLGHPLAGFLRRALRKDPHERAASASTLYKDFRKINLASFVGNLSEPLVPGARLPLSEITQECVPGWFGMDYERQQITVLCCSLSVCMLSTIAAAGHVSSDTEIDMLETLQRDQSGLCIDTAQRYGGYVAGALGNSHMFYFGYPQSAGDDARRAARTALELVSQVRRRSALLASQGVSLDIRLGIHTGMVRTMPGHVPSGVTPNIALQLERMAESGVVLVSLQARKLLDQFVDFEPVQSVSQTDPENVKFPAGWVPHVRMAGEYKSEALSLLQGGIVAQELQGRESESEQLCQAWELVKSGYGQAVLLQGEAGIGKSRLASGLCHTARREGAQLREWRCLPEHQNNALYPVLEMLKTRLHLHETNDGEEAVTRLQDALLAVGGDIAAILPILCSWLSLPLPPAFPVQQFSPDRQKNMLLSALQSLIFLENDATLSGQPCLLIIEDLHWIDQTSLELLTQMIRVNPDCPIMLLLTARPNFISPWQDSVSLIPVERLPDSAVHQLVTRLLAGKQIEAASLARLCARTDGVPLFVEELTRMLIDDLLLVEHDGVYRLDSHFDSSDIPVTLRDLLSARLARLGSAKDTAQLAAAIGREFDYNLLAEVALVDEGELQNDLEQLLAADLVYLQRRVQGDSYIFRHALIRDAAYDAMSPTIRERTHARIAQHLETGSPAEIEANLSQLARHFAFASDFGRAVHYGSREALILLQRALHHDAIILCAMVQYWISRLPDNAQRQAEIGIGQILTNALMSKYGWADERVRHSAEHTLQLLEDIEEEQRSVPVLWGLAIYHLVASHRDAVRTLTAQLLILSGKSDDSGLHVACHTINGIGCWVDGEYLRAKQSFEQVLAHYDPVQHAHHGFEFGIDSRIWAMAGMATVGWFLDTDGSAALAQAREAVAHARVLNHVPSTGLALMYLAYVHQYEGDRDGTLAVSTELLELSKKYELPAVEGYATILHCWASDNLQLADLVLQGLKNIGCMLGLPYMSSLAAGIEAHRGNYTEALARIEVSLSLCDEINEAYYKPELLRRRAMYRTRISPADCQLSRDDLQLAISLAQVHGMKRSVQGAIGELEQICGL